MGGTSKDPGPRSLLCACVCERETLCVCVCVRERESEIMSILKRA